jgi:hypothetical protein
MLGKNCWNKNYNEKNILCYNPDPYSSVAKINILHVVRLRVSLCKQFLTVKDHSTFIFIIKQFKKMLNMTALWSFETQGTVYPIMQCKNSKKLGSLIFYMPFLQRGLIRTSVLIRPCWKEAAAPIPEVAVTVFSTPNDGRSDVRNM